MDQKSPSCSKSMVTLSGIIDVPTLKIVSETLQPKPEEKSIPQLTKPVGQMIKNVASIKSDQLKDYNIFENIHCMADKIKGSYQEKTKLPIEFTLKEKLKICELEETVQNLKKRVLITDDKCDLKVIGMGVKPFESFKPYPKNKSKTGPLLCGKYPKIVGTGANSECILGPNGTKISCSQYSEVQWATPQEATRCLLRFVFTENELATHTLSGKVSPAFHNRREILPEKSKLDPARVNDIIASVLSKSGGKEQNIRATITTKCADLAKKKKRHELKFNPVNENRDTNTNQA